MRPNYSPLPFKQEWNAKWRSEMGSLFLGRGRFFRKFGRGRPDGSGLHDHVAVLGPSEMRFSGRFENQTSRRHCDEFLFVELVAGAVIVCSGNHNDGSGIGMKMRYAFRSLGKKSSGRVHGRFAGVAKERNIARCHEINRARPLDVFRKHVLDRYSRRFFRLLRLGGRSWMPCHADLPLLRTCRCRAPLLTTEKNNKYQRKANEH